MILRRVPAGAVLAALVALLLVSLVVSAGLGAVRIPARDILRFLAEAVGLAAPGPETSFHRGLFLHIRLPRVLLCALVGAALAVSGTLMQALFRNPIVEPGIVGTSAGAALGAAVIFVFGKSTVFAYTAGLGPLALPFVAFVTAFVATLFVWRVSSTYGRTSAATMILAGVAVNAFCSAGTGLMSYLARDPQARSITFWSLGSISGADWRAVAIVGSVMAIALPLVWRESAGLNALLLGEDEAALLGFDVEWLTIRVLVLNTLMVAAATAMVGVIMFVGLVVPHLLRMLRGADNRFLIPASGLCGAVLMQVIDVVTRTAVAPAELPVGIVTAAIGAPVFLWILVRHRRDGVGGGFYA
jgi:iron complex transport system permease protein